MLFEFWKEFVLILEKFRFSCDPKRIFSIFVVVLIRVMHCIYLLDAQKIMSSFIYMSESWVFYDKYHKFSMKTCTERHFE